MSTPGSDNGFWMWVKVAHILAIRDIQRKYTRSLFGPLWFALTPGLLLVVYWAVFGMALGIKWSAPDGRVIPYLPAFYSGLSLYLYLADLIPGSLRVFHSQRTFVQRSAIPIWTIWMGLWLKSSYQFAVYVLMLLVILFVYGFLSPATAAMVFILAVLMALIIGGFSLFLATIGPFFPDIENIVPPLMRALFYSAPITFPLTLIPGHFQHWLYYNPITGMVLIMRKAALYGQFTSLTLYLAYAGGGALMWLLAIFLYNRMKQVIADVV